MKHLNLFLLGESSYLDLLEEELKSLGHRLTKIENLDIKLSDVDFILYLDKLKLQKNIKLKAESLPKILLLANFEKQVDILLLQNSSQASVIQTENMIDNDEDIVDLWVDAVISLSQNEVETFNTIDFDFSSDVSSDLDQTIKVKKDAEESVRVIEPGEQDEELKADESVARELTAKERKKILVSWNDTSAPYPKDKTIHQLFEEQVDKTPDNIAVVFEDEKLSYKDLNKKSNQLAHLIRAKYQEQNNKDLKPDSLIGLCVERSLDMIIGILGILKAGAAYVPLDPDYPQDRLEYMIEDSHEGLIITQKCVVDKDGFLDKLHHDELVIIDSDKVKAKLHKESTDNLPAMSGPNDLAYVIYTSGSTGKPNGVMIEHQSLGNLSNIQRNFFHCNEDTRSLQFAPFSFDAATWEIFVSITSGGELYVVTGSIRQNANEMVNYLKKNKISLATLPPALLSVFPRVELPDLKTLIIAGDTCEYKTMDFWSEAKFFINAYGPTESTVCVSMHKYERGDSATNIGKPNPNARLYILDNNHNPCPIGTPGELYIGGAGLARGYLNQEKLTKERFISNPFAKELRLPNSDRIYKTGDLVRWLPDGNIEFLGRTDFQVKIRGFRIELGEIENVLARHPLVSQAVVMACEYQGEQQKGLSAYIVLDNKYKDSSSTQALKEMFSSGETRLWPSVSDYGYYDEFIFNTLSQNEMRKSFYRQAFSRYVKGKVILDVGTGKDAFLAKICISCGAKKVYGVEIIESACMFANKMLKEEGLTEKIEIIHGDIHKVKLPEKVDICVSQLVGIIGSSEGIIPILNSVHDRMLKPGGLMLPARAKTYIVAASLPDDLVENPRCDAVAGHYVNEIFKQEGKVFDLRLGLADFSTKYILSDQAVFESLDFSHPIEIEEQNSLKINIKEDGVINSFVLWSSIIMDESLELDASEDNFTILPMVFILDQTHMVFKGDVIHLNCIRSLASSGRSCNHILSGELVTKQGDRFKIYYVSEHISNNYGNTPFYQALLKDGKVHIKQQSGDMIRQKLNNHLSESLPEYMIPNFYTILESMPLTPNGKINRRDLPEPDMSFMGEEYVAPRNEVDQQLADILCEALRLDKVGIEDDFFRIGLNSLIVTKIILSVNLRLHCQLVPKDIYDLATIKKLSDFISSSDQLGQSELKQYYIKPNKENIYEPFSLSLIQQAYLIGREDIFDLGDYGTHFYFENLFSELDHEHLEIALNVLIKRHHMLRAVFENGQQQFLEEIPVYKIKYLDVSNLSETDQENAIIAWRDEMSHQRFNSSCWPLFDVRVLHFSDRVLLFFSIDILILDGLSVRIIFSELSQLYQNLEVNLPTLDITFRDYQVALDSIRRSDLYENDKNYWMNKLGDMPFGPQLPLKINPSEIKSPKYIRVTKNISSDLWSKFTEKSKSYGLSPTSAILVVFGAVLSKFSKDNHFLINLTLFNRLGIHEQVEQIVGDFTTLELLELNLDLNSKFSDEIKSTHDLLWDDLGHKLFTGVDLQRELMRYHGLDFKGSLAPVVLTSILGMNSDKSIFIPEGEDFGGAYIGEHYGITQTSQVWLDNKALEVGGEFIAEWDYVEGLFPDGMIEKMHNAYCRLIEYFAQNDWDKVIPEILPKADKELIDLANAKENTGILPKETLHGAFIKSAKLNADKPAVITSKGDISYKQLLDTSSQIAHCLADQKIKPNTLVAVLAEKGEHQVGSCLGIMQAGAAYLPLNMEWPIDRIKDVLEQGKVKIILATKSASSKYNLKKDTKCKIYLLDEDSEWESYSKDPLSLDVSLDDIAYVIFTSGSTGKPKGVTISHQGAMNTLNDINTRFSVSKKDSVFGLSRLSFDLSVYDIFGLLAVGGSIVIPDDAQYKDPEAWVDYMLANQITIWNTVPMLMQMLVEYAKDLSDDVKAKLAKHLKLVLLSGDWIPLDLPDKIKEIFPQAIVISLGGATECSIWSILYPIEKVDPAWSAIPYGQAMDNQKMYVLNQQLQHCPVGVTGEICIGGVGVALNYWGDKEKTDQSFIIHPVTKERLYKTGDLGKWREDGNIEFIGRVDQQVKVGGYRIELGEIEHAIEKLPQISEALVLCTEGKAKKDIIAYYIAPNESKTDKLDHDLLMKKNQLLDDSIGLNLDSVYNRLKAKELDAISNECKNRDLDYLKLLKSLCVKLSIFQQVDERVSLHNVMAVNRIANRYEYWFKRAFETLEKNNYIRKIADYYLCLNKVSIENKDNSYQSLGGISAEQLLSVLQEETHSALIYTSKDTVSEYQNMFGEIYSISELMFKKLLGFFNTSDDLSILEIGSGYGTFSKHIFPYLQKRRNMNYLFSDISNYFFDKAKKEYGQYNFIDYSLYNMDEPPEFQGIMPASFDVIIAVSVLHDAKDIKYTLRALSALLNPGGFVFIIEETKWHDFYNLNMGLQSGIDSFDDYRKEARNHPLIGVSEWLDLLKQTGFNRSESFTPDDSECFYMGLDLIIGSKKPVGSDFKISNIRAELQKMLPNYMMPAFFIELNRFPISASGKIDRKQLPLPYAKLSTEEFVARRNEIEQKLADIWCDILKIDKVGIHDNFFHLGGDSLVAVKLVARIHERFNCDIKIKVLFDQPKLMELAAWIEGALKVGTSKEYLAIENTPRSEEGNPMSFAQERLWFLDQFEGANQNYNIPIVLRLHGSLDIESLTSSINQLITRHESFRTVFSKNKEGVGVQKILDHIEIKLNVEKLKGNALEEGIHQEINTSFDLVKGPLLRARLFELSTDEHVFVFNHHHIISDGSSIDIFAKELSEFYQAHVEKREPKLDPLPIQYVDFSAWQRAEFNKPEFQDKLKFWTDHLADYTDLQLPIDKRRPTQFTYKGANIQFNLDKALSKQLTDLAQQHGTTLYMVLLMAFNILMSRYSGQEDVILGSPIANRYHHDVEGLIGFFVNTLVLRNQVDGNKSVNELLSIVAANALNAFEHQEVPFEQLVDKLDVVRDTTRNPIIQVMFSLQAFGVDSTGGSTFNLPGINVTPYTDVTFDVAKFDLSLFIQEGADCLEGRFEYCTDLFNQDSIERMIRHFERLLQSIVKNANQKVKDLRILTDERRQQILVDWNNTNADYPKDKTIYQSFEEQVDKTPDNIAVVFEDEQLSYLELNQKSNQLARLIRKEYKQLNQKELKPDSLIGLCVERSLDMIVSILGILKSGAAYVPLDPNYPQDRLEYMIEDSHEGLIISQKDIVAKDSFLDKLHHDELLVIDSDKVKEKLKKESTDNLPVISGPNDLAYVIYTSGSTGKPKGVMLEHDGMINRINWMHKEYGLTENDKILQKTPFSFDVSVWELLWGIIYGGKLIFAKPSGHKDPKYLLDMIKQYGITKIHFVPSMLQLLMDTIKDRPEEIAKLRSLKDVFCSGEELPLALAELVSDTLPSRLHNLYGPTEASIDVSYYDCTGLSKIDISSVPIGKPIENIHLYVLDNNLNPSPICTPGELYIGGAGLARGYLNQEELTKERFIANPFAKEVGLPNSDRVYKTGDLVRWLPDGNIEFLGRTDFQVKIRGFRVELGEIENTLAKHNSLSQVTVVALDKKDQKYLAAYYVVAKDTREPSIDELRDYLSATLPDYMVPTSFMELDAMPLTSNGKINRKALPTPDMSLMTEEYVAPRNDIERNLAEIWCELLNVEQVGIHDNFFHLGGHSLLSISLSQKMTLSVNLDISTKMIFNYPTIGKLATFISSNNELVKSKLTEYYIKPNKKDFYKPFPLSLIQQAYLFGREDIFELGGTATHVYFESLFTKLDYKKFKKALNILIQRHPMLRVIFENGEQRFIKDVSDCNITLQDVSKLSDIKQDKAITLWRDEMSHQVFDPSQWPLFDIRISQCSDKVILHFSMDGLILDGFSFGIFLPELTKLYQNIKASLPVLDITFRDYQIALKKVRASELYSQDKDYWMDRLDVLPFGPKLPLKVNPSEISIPRSLRCTRNIPANIWSSFKKKVQSYNLSPTSAVLGIYGLVLARFSQDNHFLINLTLFNRLGIHEQVEQILGDFTTLELLELKLDINNKFLNLAKSTHDRLWEDLDHKLFSGVEVQRELMRYHNLDFKQSVAPVVLTSILGMREEEETFISEDYIGEGYSITQTSQVWLDNKALEVGGEFVAEWDYVEGLFPDGMIEKMHDAYCSLIEYFAQNDWDKPIPDILPKADKELIYLANSKDNTEILPKQTLHGAFIKAAKLNADKPAVITSKGDISYKQLLDKSSQIAHCLANQKVKPNTLVAVLAEKGEHQVSSCLGIMQAGAAYLPLNIEWPIARIKDVLAQGKAKIILTTRSVRDKYNLEKDTKCKVYLLDEKSAWESYSKDPLSLDVSLDDIAYVVFTSGSTGKPKGVTISHQGAMNTLNDINTRFSVSKKDSVFGLSRLSFDLSVYDIFGLLAVGGSIVIPDDAQYKDPEAWVDYMLANQITIWNTVPMLMQMLVEYAKDLSDDVKAKLAKHLKLVLLSGDWIPLDLPDKIKEIFPQARVISLGGATEGSIWSILYPIEKVDPAWSAIPYGQAMDNQKMYVLNQQLQHCPVSVTGEICIGGVGVALNYWGDKEKTDQSFIIHPVTKERLYKTGDLGKWREDGNIEFMGRVDQQVKVGGYRIELGDVESVLHLHPNVHEAVVEVVGDEKASKKLAAYYVLKKDIKLQFMLARHGICKEGFMSEGVKLRKIDVTKDIKDSYFRRKSYRNFLSDNIEVSDLEILLKNIDQSNVISKQKNRFNIDLEFLSKFLAPIQAYHDDDLTLPKYRYPSPGTTYSVRAYISVYKDMPSLSRGHYYYHPDEHTLYKISDCDSKEPANKTLQVSLVGYLPAIIPSYGDVSEKFCQLEAGYMLPLLESSLAEKGYGLVNNKERCLISSLDKKDNILLGQYEIIQKDSDLAFNSLSKYILLRKDQTNDDLAYQLYHWEDGALSLVKEFKPDNSFFNQKGDNGSIIANSRAFLLFSEEQKFADYCAIGYQSQLFMELSSFDNIGSCALGYLPLDVKLQEVLGNEFIQTAISLGRVTDDQVASIHTEKVKVENLAEDKDNTIKGYLQQKLPSYMVPEYLIELDKLPLSANGKVDRKALPQPDVSLMGEEYVAPRNEMEQKLADIWCEVLKLDKISVHDSFFGVGGDSMLAISVISSMKKIGLELGVSDLFKYKTIVKLGEYIGNIKLLSGVKGGHLDEKEDAEFFEL